MFKSPVSICQGFGLMSHLCISTKEMLIIDKKPRGIF